MDQQRYAYTAWSLTPYSGTKEEALLELAGEFFRWAGPATASDFQTFAGLGVHATKDILDGLSLEPMEPGSELLMHPEDVGRLHTFSAPKEPAYALLGSIDSLMHLRRDASSLMDAEALDNPLLGKSRGAASTLLGVDDHVIVDRGRIIGIWQFDPEAGKIVWKTFRPAHSALRDVIRSTEEWIREDLGDARSFSLDSPASRKPRLERLRN